MWKNISGRCYIPALWGSEVLIQFTELDWKKVVLKILTPKWGNEPQWTYQNVKNVDLSSYICWLTLWPLNLFSEDWNGREENKKVPSPRNYHYRNRNTNLLQYTDSMIRILRDHPCAAFFQHVWNWKDNSNNATWVHASIRLGFYMMTDDNAIRLILLNSAISNLVEFWYTFELIKNGTPCLCLINWFTFDTVLQK